MFSFIFPSINPVAFEAGPFAIHWYGLAYVIGILFAWQYARRIVSNPDLWNTSTIPNERDMDDLLPWIPVGIIVGGRIGYIALYDLTHYLENPARIFALSEGGMSFHGGALGVLLTLLLFAWLRNLHVLKLTDIIAASAPFGIGLVRCANFINGELWGRPSDVPWAFVFPEVGPEARHPSQLYEAGAEGVLLFILLRLLTHKHKKLNQPGYLTGAFISLYGCARTAIEFVREPDPQLGYLAGGWVTMGMLLSIPMLFVGAWIVAKARSHSKISDT